MGKQTGNVRYHDVSIRYVELVRRADFNRERRNITNKFIATKSNIVRPDQGISNFDIRKGH
jgi:hypothetical protein